MKSSKILKFLSIFICIGFLLYSFFLLELYYSQDSFIYRPSPREQNNLLEEMPKLQEVTYSLPDGTRVYAWYAKPLKNKQTIIYFHGNVKYAEYHATRLKELYQAGFGLLFPEYRGFGDIKGKVSQESMQTDALTAVKYLTSTGTKPEKIVVYGHSLGTYAAVFAASQQEKPLNGVILEAPFLSVEHMAQELYGAFAPVSFLLKNKHPSYQYIDAIQTRLFVAHGKKDKTIPYHHGWQLYEKAQNPKVFFSSDKAGHSSLPEYGFMQALIDWLNEKSK